MEVRCGKIQTTQFEVRTNTGNGWNPELRTVTEYQFEGDGKIELKIQVMSQYGEPQLYEVGKKYTLELAEARSS